MILGSSSVPELAGPGRKLRWVALLALALVAVVLAARNRVPVSRPQRRALALGAWFGAVALVSSVWSVDPRLSFGRACSFAVLLLAAGGLGLAVRTRPRLPSSLLLGVLGGVVAGSLGSLLLLLVDHARAVQAAKGGQPARLQGLGENPDTLAMLEGIAMPVALWAFAQARGFARRSVALAVVLLLLGSISASGSRGGLIAALVGGLGYTLTLREPVRRRLAFSLAVLVAVFGAAAGTRIPKPPAAGAGPTPTSPSGPSIPAVGQSVGTREQEYLGRLEDEVNRVYAGSRSFFTSSGRVEAWYGAIKRGNSRPLLGFGFGTEDKVFIDRVYNFQSYFAENSFIGLYLQLGSIGVLSLMALLGAVGWTVAVAVRRSPAGSVAPALAGLVAAGVALMVVQSYAYSVGNVATVTFWTACLMVGGVAALPEREPVSAAATSRGKAVAPA